MFEKLSNNITDVPQWWKKDTRFWRLQRYDLLLDGKFYDHLKHAFYDEAEGDGASARLIPLANRRPCVQFKLPGMVARMTSRKLFAGRHVPKFMHQDAEAQKAVRRLVRRSKLYGQMMEICYRGSVGSVAATFDLHGDDRNPKVKINVHLAKYCVPYFDPSGELELLRVQYITTAAALKALGAGSGDLDDKKMYWYVREWTADEYITYKPVESTAWNPVDGFVDEEAKKTGWVDWRELCEPHNFGFVPAQWFRNLAGCDGADGDCTFAPAISNSIDLDYTMSQLGRGVRYNAAPQLVVRGDPTLAGGADPMRDPLSYIQVAVSKKSEGDEGSVGEGDAKLLEMTGRGIEAGLKYVDTLRKQALEQIAAARKDPEQMKGPMSGRAMEYLDDDWHDLIMELRSQYGEYGALPLVKKIVIAVSKKTGSNEDPKADGIYLRWPRLFQPTPMDIAQLMPAFKIAVNPMGAPPKAPAVSGNRGPNGVTGGRPAQPGPDEADAFMTPQQIRQWLKDNLDLGWTDDEEDDYDEGDTVGEIEDDETPPSPEPLPNGGGPGQNPDGEPPADPEAPSGVVSPAAPIVADAVGRLGQGGNLQ